MDVSPGRFRCYCLDNSAEALKLCNEMLLNYNCNASLSHASMTEMPYENNSMDVIIDVFSSTVWIETRG